MLSTLSNEVLFFIAFAFNFICILAACRLGKNWLFALMGTNLLFTAFFGGKLFDFFGYMLSVSLFSYASLFVIANILIEHFGKKEAEKAIWMGFSVFALYLVYQVIILGFKSHPTTEGANQALSFLLSTTPRLVIASILAYLVSQFVNAWAYQQIGIRFGRQNIWLRANLSTLLAQFVDCFVFFPVAFFLVLPNAVLLHLILVTFVAKAVLCVLNSPAIYASARVINKS